jgi:hypothetical protein
MTLGELAKKRGEPIGEFVKKVQQLGFSAGSHAKRLTQVDLNNIVGLLDGTSDNVSTQTRSDEERIAENPNVLMIKLPNGKRSVLFVDASIDDDGNVQVEVLQNSIENTYGDSLLEFRKQLGMKLGVN